MVGLSHVAFRTVLRGYLPQGARTIWPTEMLNSRRLPSENLATTPETMRASSETHLVPQILGNEEEPIAKSVQRLEFDWCGSGAAGIDINMGCPLKKALAHNYGVALMGDAGYAARIVEMTVKHTKLPVSVKLRAGHQNDVDYLISFMQSLESAGAQWLTLHPRTTEQKRRGTADWSQIRLARQSLSIPIIGNGDVQTARDVVRMLSETGCDHVMVGRALLARPWLLWQVGEDLGFAAPAGRDGERAPRTPSEEAIEYYRFMRQLTQAMQFWFTPDLALRKLRFAVKNAMPWLVFGHELYSRVMRAKNFDEWSGLLDEFFTFDQAMVAHTELRQ